MRFVDAHIHLSDPEYSEKIGQIMKAAQESNVVALVSNSMNFETSVLSLRLADKYKGLIYVALGIHPWNAPKLAPDEVEKILNLIFQHGKNREKVVAIGEIGLDPQYAKGKELRELQAKIFHEMLRAAEKLRLPIIVHSRWTAPKIMDVLASYNLAAVLWHWFSDPIELLPQIVERGHYISEGPPTIYSPKTQEIIRRAPLTNLLTETDGPVHYYGPFKDKLTTPTFIPQVVKTIAEIKGTRENDVAEQILHNFTNLFKINL